MDPFVLSLAVWLLLPFVLLFLWLRARKRLRILRDESEAQRGADAEKIDVQSTELKTLHERFDPALSIEAEVQMLEAEAARRRADIDAIRKTYTEKKAILDRLLSEVAIYDERLAFAELGVYEPHFDFGDSEAYKAKIKEVRERQKAMISQKKATVNPQNLTVDGSKSKGKTMVNRQARLTLRAFNNECEAAIANTRWNNVVAMEKRIETSAKAIDDANTSLGMTINRTYLRLRLEELFLTHEYRERLKAEKDERAELARSEREEKKLLADAAKAEKEEARYQQLLDKARLEAAGSDAPSDEMAKRIRELEEALADAHSATERAQAMAERTKSGYVYVISNIGSFGEDVVKIGLTRRLDPDDRVKELGDASVPFSFDTHAMIYSDAAPALEASLHREFQARRINMSNMRKEFFRVSLEEVEEAVERLAPDASFFKDREAQEWQETLSRRAELLTVPRDVSDSGLPSTI